MIAPNTIDNSTSVRANNRWRTVFRTLEHVAPDVGARLATRLWCTVPTSAGRRRDNRPRPGAAATVRLPGGRSVMVESWGAGPPMYLVHGWGGWRGQLGAFVDPLVAAGFQAVALDGPSHGDSAPGALGPRRSTPAELTDALIEVSAVHGSPAGVVAHSMGCAATALAVRDGLPAPKLAFVAPSASPADPLRLFRIMLGYGQRTERRLHRRLERITNRLLSEFDVIPMADHVQFPPTLVVHDRQDREVDFSEGEAIARAWPDAELVTTIGLGHQRILRDSHVIARVARFITG